LRNIRRSLLLLYLKRRLIEFCMKRFYGDLYQMQLQEFLNVIKKLYQFYASQPHSPSNNQSDVARASSIDNFLMENQNGEQGEASVVGVGSCRPTHPGSILNRDVPMASHQCLQRRQKKTPTPVEWEWENPQFKKKRIKMMILKASRMTQIVMI
jgi:hypothetical protein